MNDLNRLKITVGDIHLARRTWLRRHLRRPGVKQYAIACAAGIGSGQLSGLKKGRRPISDAVWQKLRAAADESAQATAGENPNQNTK